MSGKHRDPEAHRTRELRLRAGIFGLGAMLVMAAGTGALAMGDVTGVAIAGAGLVFGLLGFFFGPEVGS